MRSKESRRSPEEVDRFWEKEQTKADVEVFILDEVFASLPTPPFTAEEKKLVAVSLSRLRDGVASTPNVREIPCV